MNTTLDTELIRMRHARAVAEVSAYTACANKDIATFGSWTCDWSIGINQAIAEALSAEKELAALVKLGSAEVAAMKDKVLK